MTERGALKLFRQLNHPVIAKPNLGSRSRHTTTHINTEAELLTAFRKALKLSPWVVIEEELSGFVFRITLIGGKLAGALRREPPFVTGDGVSTVRVLVDKENKNPGRHNGIFHEIGTGPDATAELTRQGLTWKSVPEKNRFVALDQKVGRGQGGSNTEMLPKVHPENVKLFEKLAKVLNDPLVGVDFIMQDIEKPWTEQKLCGAIECNSLPFLDLHHMPLYGEALDPSSALWDVVFPASKPVSR
jgi:cyanophycin synthetase